MRVLYFLSALFFCLSFLVSDHYPPWTAYYNELGVGVALALLVVAFIFSLRGRVVVPSEALFFGVLSLVPLAQFGLGVIFFSGSAWVVFLYLSSVVLAVVIGRAWAVRGVNAAPHFFFISILFAAVFSAILALYQAFGFNFLGSWAVIMAPGQRAGGNLAQPNQLATLLLFGVVALVYGFERRMMSRYVVAGLVILIALGVIATQSRAGLLGCVWLLIWFFVLSRRIELRLSIWFGVLLCIFVGVGGFYFYQTLGGFASYSGYQLSGQGESGASRLDIGSRPPEFDTKCCKWLI